MPLQIIVLLRVLARSYARTVTLPSCWLGRAISQFYAAIQNSF